MNKYRILCILDTVLHSAYLIALARYVLSPPPRAAVMLLPVGARLQWLALITYSASLAYRVSTYSIPGFAVAVVLLTALPNSPAPSGLGYTILLASLVVHILLLHLSRPPLSKRPDHTAIPAQLEPDPSVVDIMSFAIDHYFVVIAYAAFFLVNSWLSNFMDCKFDPRIKLTQLTCRS